MHVICEDCGDLEGSHPIIILLAEAKRCFTAEDVLFSATTAWVKDSAHDVNTETQRPLQLRLYQVSPPIQGRLDRELVKILNLEVIIEFKSPWAARTVLVLKPD